LADVPGVGPALASRLGQTILNALSADTDHNATEKSGELLPLEVVIRNWRAEVARQMGVPAYLVISDMVIREIATQGPQSREQLAKVPGVGPRTLAKFANNILAIVADAPAQR
jgi:superfamily II DNA helicase RecQ